MDQKVVLNYIKFDMCQMTINSKLGLIVMDDKKEVPATAVQNK